MNANPNRKTTDTNPDPITGTPGSHPVGTGLGAAAAGAAGAGIGSLAGPVGTVVGAVVGAVAGGLAGKATAETIDPTAEEAYWNENHKTRSYAAGSEYSSFQPAYRSGWEARGQYPDRTFDDVAPELETNWATARGTSKLEWNKAKLAARDAFEHVDNRTQRT